MPRFGPTGDNVTFKHGHKFKPGATFDGAKVTKVYEDGSAILSDGRTIDAETGRIKGKKRAATQGQVLAKAFGVSRLPTPKKPL